MIVAAQAGAALKKQVLELGGSDPFIVLADADIEATAAMAITARFTNAGQSCVNAKRFIVEEAIADRFAEAMRAGAETLHMGDPADPATTLGRSEEHTSELQSLMRISYAVFCLKKQTTNL